MKIALVGHGTRGDVQPCVCLGLGLKKRGHDVRVIAPTNMQSFVERSGLAYVSAGFDAQAVLEEPEAVQMLAGGRMVAFLNFLKERDEKNRESLHDAWLEGLRGVDAIISHPMAEEVLCAIAAHYKIPALTMYFGPFLKSAEHPALLFPYNLGPLNRLSHSLFHYFVRRAARAGTERIRSRLGLAQTNELYSQQVRRRSIPVLLSYSTHIAQRPRDYPKEVLHIPALFPDASLKAAWGETGLAGDLIDWLDQGPPPFFIGFGSMPVVDPERTLSLTRKAVEKLGQRAVVSAGWSRFENFTDETIKIVGGVDHAALFARCQGAVHHGGAGTTHASLLAGVPTLVASVFADQPYWGRRVRDLGVGDTFSYSKLSVERLVGGLKTLRKPVIREQAGELGRRIQNEETSASYGAELVEQTLLQMSVPE